MNDDSFQNLKERHNESNYDTNETWKLKHDEIFWIEIIQVLNFYVEFYNIDLLRLKLKNSLILIRTT